MADATFANDIFRQFLIERGYQLTLKAFENEIKEDKRRHIRVSSHKLFYLNRKFISIYLINLIIFSLYSKSFYKYMLCTFTQEKSVCRKFF